MIDFDHHSLNITCPQCGHETPETIGRLKTNPQLTCGGCGNTITIQADNLKAGIDSVQKQLADLLGILGK